MKTKKVFVLCILALLLIGTTGCSISRSEESEYYIYHLNTKKTKTVPVAYKPKGETMGELIDEMIRQLSGTTDSMEYQKPLSESVGILSWYFNNGQLRLNFGSNYNQMDNVTEVLCRAAVVRTLIQIEGVSSIIFYVGELPLMNKNGIPIGQMTEKSFVENPGDQINAIQTATVTLYFANSQGNGLVQEVQECHFNSNISLEKLVMERLLKKPVSVEGKSALPSGTKLVSISVLNGMCFVNLDSGFLKQNYEIQEAVVIYSIVNSLAELPHINKVQISVNGDTDLRYRDKFSLNTVYERNLDYVIFETKGTE